MRHEPITTFTLDQRAFLDMFDRHKNAHRSNAFSHGAASMYMYLLNKRRRWFRIKMLLSRLNGQLRLHPKDEKEIEETIAELITRTYEYPNGINSPEIAAFCSAMLHAVYAGADMWKNRYEAARGALEDQIRLTASLNEQVASLTKAKDMLIRADETRIDVVVHQTLVLQYLELQKRLNAIADISNKPIQE